MKGLLGMTNIQRAKLLFDLFPDDTAAFVPYAAEMAEKIKKEREQLKGQGTDTALFPGTFWLELAEEISRRIRSSDGKLQKSSTQFSEQLFEGDRAFLTKHCLLQYSISDKVKNLRFRQGVDLLFAMG
ncbi:hypothetical protein [Chitinophaga filiformis]|uniref:Uncharacterized protein n=1 Tax=Chitinophaga filiformis TaxID=104663 RepID=A0ABY4HW48_CHIFI|nr:hypothetical protein [Chitinophaga filiformis]UPK68015.1 hypothetical protein MYF79_23975 [Chitinophaga filiformis]